MNDLKHISKPYNNFKKHDVYYGNHEHNGFSSFRDYCFGYVEVGNIGVITFIQKLVNPFNR